MVAREEAEKLFIPHCAEPERGVEGLWELFLQGWWFWDPQVMYAFLVPNPSESVGDVAACPGVFGAVLTLLRSWQVGPCLCYGWEKLSGGPRACVRGRECRQD